MTYDRSQSEWLGELHTVDAEQYGTLAIFPAPDSTADQVIEHARRMGCIYHEDSLDDETFVVVLRPEIGPELWSETALRRSFAARAADNESLRERGDLMHKPAEY